MTELNASLFLVIDRIDRESGSPDPKQYLKIISYISVCFFVVFFLIVS